MSQTAASSLMTIIAAAISFGISAITGKYLIPWLHKLKYGQTIKEIGPTWHAKKQGTPTMGGIMFILGTVVAIVICLPIYIAIVKAGNQYAVMTTLQSVKIWVGFVFGIFCGFTGFLDDYISIKRHENTGLTVKQKFGLQIFATAVYLAAIGFTENWAGSTSIPFVGNVDMGIWFYIIMFIMIVGFVNAVNLTDGIDGLCSTVTFVAEISFMVCATLMHVYHVGIFAAAVAGGCLGFLVWNFFPAKVFMGDTGSLFLGGMFCATAIACDLPIFIPLVGLIYLCETGSVMIQVTYFKLTHGKRIFKMTPIHHSFEMDGWSEVKIVTVFSAVTLVMGAIACLLTALGLK